MSSEHERLTIDNHDRLDRIGRWFRKRWLIPVAFILLVVVNAGESFFINRDAAAITQLQANAAVVSAYQQQQAVIFNRFITAFVREQNYLCRIAAARAIIDHLETPPPGVCNVALGP